MTHQRGREGCAELRSEGIEELVEASAAHLHEDVAMPVHIRDVVEVAQLRTRVVDGAEARGYRLCTVEDVTAR